MPANTQIPGRKLVSRKPRCRAWSAALGLLAFLLTHAHAGTWSTPQFVAGDSDVSTAGSLVWAYHFTFTSTVSSAVVNGVTFETAPYTGAGISDDLVFGNTSAIWGQDTAFSGTVPAYTSLSPEYRTVLEGAAYWTGSGGTFSLNSLEAGQEYQLQFWVQDARAGLPTGTLGRTDLLEDSAGNEVTVKYNDGVSSAGSLGQYVFYTFTATSSMELISVNAGPGGSADTAQVNAMQLRMVPEPSACLLFMGGAAAILWRRRRRGA